MALPACVEAFILALLCNNPILKGAFLSQLTATVLLLDQEITILTAQLGRLNVVNALLNAEIRIVQALVDKVKADFNLILIPLQQFGECPTLANLSEFLQTNAVSKTFAGLQKKLYELNRAANLAVIQDAIIQKKEQLKADFEEFIDKINILCP